MPWWIILRKYKITCSSKGCRNEMVLGGRNLTLLKFYLIYFRPRRFCVPYNAMNFISSIKVSKLPSTCLKVFTLGTISVFLNKSLLNYQAPQQIIDSLSPASCFLFIQINNIFSTFSSTLGLHFVNTVTLIATTSTLIASLFFRSCGFPISPYWTVWRCQKREYYFQVWQ